jgi:hypothetical protein
MAANDERDFEVVFKLTYGCRQGRLRDVAGVGCAGEVPFAGERNKIAEMTDKHADNQGPVGRIFSTSIGIYIIYITSSRGEALLPPQTC